MWPKIITVRGVKVQVDDIDEFITLVKGLDQEGIDAVGEAEQGEKPSKVKPSKSSLNHTDRALLCNAPRLSRHFVWC
jgi:hypothetical protein